ncbi:LacI family DNA-binding transcriptional regulator [Oceanitalea stevensii]|uniref:LacI family DNA-binding transcriptional regulator n=1 Tax=Oceanitalea stevensii TaxID=2763072 RepID=A0ABR8YYS9_9MICO|nr:LacI family DNA-binding transcriptional regulator [Oceanitalea stevensii]MBD8061067.1 LacI family DNA-binding transcriptional regulator [Oceanitalea stevensii]
MTSKRVTLADVARHAGVSSSTASLVLSGRGRELRISDAVHERVRAAAETLGYRRNTISVGLRKGSTNTIGFVSDTVASSQLAGGMIRGALAAARDSGFMLFMSETGGGAAQERQAVEAMLDHRVDGLILASMFTRQRDALPEELDTLPTVLLNALPPEGRQLTSIIPDEHAAGRAAAEQLLTAGHRDIHLIGAGPGLADAPAASEAGHLRLTGMLEVLAEAGVTPASGYPYRSWNPAHGWEAVHDLLEHGTVPEALICFNDRLAFGAYQALQEAGLRVPEDASIISFDDAPLAGWLRPALTTFAIPHRTLGSMAVDMLVAALQDSERHPLSRGVHTVDMPLRTRGSLAPRPTT